jgi:hypothetical protein
MVTCAHVVIPGGHIQVAGEIVVIETVKPPHEVMRNPHARRQVGAQDIHLNLLEVTVGCRDKPLEFKHQARIMRPDWNGDLLPGGVSLAPISGGPMLVERLQGAIALSQELLEQLAAAVTVAHPRKFVVRLPADHIGVRSEALRHGAHNALGGCDHVGRSRAVMAAVAVLHLPATLVDGKHIRVGCREPGWRRGSGGTQHADNAVFSQQTYRAFEPIELDLALGRLHRGPGKFRQASHIQVGLFHQANIFGPARLRPMLGVIS